MASPHVPSNRDAPPAEFLSSGSSPLSRGALPSCAPSPAAAIAVATTTSPLVPSTAPLAPLSFAPSTGTAALSDVSSAVPLGAADAGHAAASAAHTSAAHLVPSVTPSTRRDCYCSLLDFLLLVGQLKKLKRTGWLRSGIQPHNAETVAEHSFRAAACALLIGSDSQSAELIAQGKLDKNKCVKMALVHDLAEALVGDITPFCPVSRDEKRRREREAMKQICSLLPAAPPVSSAALRGCPACTACWESFIKSDSHCAPGCNETITTSSMDSSGRSSTTDASGAAAEIFSLFEEYEAGETEEAKFVLDIDKFEMVLQAYEYEAEAYSNSMPLKNGNKRLGAREPERSHSAETRGSQGVQGLALLNASEPHQQDLKEEADIHRQQKISIFPQGEHESQQQGWQQQEQAQQGGQSDVQSTTQMLQRRQQGLTAYPPTSLRQSRQLESHELTDKQQQRQQQDQHQLSHDRSHETQLLCIQRRNSKGTETVPHGMRLSSFFQTTKGMFRSGLFHMLDALLRDRRKELHATEQP